MPTGMFGTANGMAKLTDMQVGEIKRLYKRGVVGCGYLAQLFGVTKHNVKLIVNGETRTDHHALKGSE